MNSCAGFPSQEGGVIGGVTVVRIYNETLNEVDHRLFGQFMERPASGEPGPEAGLIPGTHSLQPEVLRLLDEMNIPIIRFPGGSAIQHCERHWPDFIDNVPGQDEERPIGRFYGFYEFLTDCETLKAEPMLVVNFRAAVWKEYSLEKAAQLAAGLVAYANAPVGADLPCGMPDWPAARAASGHPEPFGVRIFQLGNEWAGWTGSIAKQTGIINTPEQVEWTKQCIRAFAIAMRQVDPSIELIIDGQVWDDDDFVFVDMLLADQSLKEVVQYVAVHYYRPWGVKSISKNGEECGWEDLTDLDVWRACISVPDIDSNGVSVFNDRAFSLSVGHGWPIAMTEWNWNGWGDETGNPVFRSAYMRGVGAAGMLNAMLRSGGELKMGFQSMLVGSEWGIMAVRVDPEAKHKAVMTPTGQMTAFYGRCHGSRRLRVEMDGLEYFNQPVRLENIQPAEQVALLDIVATATGDRIYMHVINRDFENDRRITIDLQGMTVGGNAVSHCMQGRIESGGIWEIVAQEIDREVSAEDDRLQTTLPPRSVSIVEIPLVKLFAD